MKSLIPRWCLQILVCFCVMPFFVGCSDGEIYKHSHTFPQSTWNRIEDGKSVFFQDVAIKDIESPYHIYVSFFHTPQVNVDRIQIIMRITSPSGVEKESVHGFPLKDREGKFIGEPMGDVFEIEERCKVLQYFNEPGDYKIEILNFMHQYAVSGLVSMGLRIEKAEVDYNIED